MSADRRLEANTPDVAAKVIDGEAIIMNLSNGHYYSLDGVGASVWQCLEAGLTVGEASASVASRYGLDPKGTEDALTALVADLLEEGLLRHREGGALEAEPEVDWPDSYTTPRLVKYTDMAELLALDPPMPGLGVAN